MEDEPRTTWTPAELLYAATSRCKCGAGLAHPLDHEETMKVRAWCCSAVMLDDTLDPKEHDSYPFAFYKVREEASINNRGAFTTRPEGTVALVVDIATCGACWHEWQSEPYSRAETGKNWRPGPCPNCANENGAGMSSTSDSPRISTRGRTLVFEAGAPKEAPAYESLSEAIGRCGLTHESAEGQKRKVMMDGVAEPLFVGTDWDARKWLRDTGRAA